uniref:Uncharacterized protein n=1 Tax=Romanomermis culicivorax TaxID=13658 RepID=A0A915LBC5_ROMCU
MKDPLKERKKRINNSIKKTKCLNEKFTKKERKDNKYITRSRLAFFRAVQLLKRCKNLDETLTSTLKSYSEVKKSLDFCRLQSATVADS